MFENATTLQLKTGKLEIVLYLLRTEIVPLLKKQPGLLQLGLVPGPDRITVTVISAWTSQAAARSAEQQCVYLKAVSHLAPYLARELNSTSGSLNPLVRFRFQLS
jgi:hypothetical protein